MEIGASVVTRRDKGSNGMVHGTTDALLLNNYMDGIWRYCIFILRRRCGSARFGAGCGKLLLMFWMLTHLSFSLQVVPYD
jgi:hypothetical protein